MPKQKINIPNGDYFPMIIPIIVLFIVFILIAIRKIGTVNLQLWQIMLSGAVVVLLTGQIAPMRALSAINIDVILFLFGMFIIGQALEDSGYLARFSNRFFKNAKSVDHLIILILFGMGFASAFLMNDTLAIIGTPVVLILAKTHRLSPKLMLLTLAFAVTIGSVMSPIGNPQNLLIALDGYIENPFITFIHYLLLPTIINLFLAYLVLKFFYKKDFHDRFLVHKEEKIKELKLARLSKVSLLLVGILIIFKIILVFLNLNIDFKLTYISLISALPIIIFSNQRFQVIKRIDWYTLIFFIAMFILMQSVWDSGFFQSLFDGRDIATIPIILFLSVGLSQFISNVPMVALYLPLLGHFGAGVKELVALAVGSTIAGNMLILGAASNVIIIQNAEKRGETLTFLEFAKIGIPLTFLNICVYWLFFLLIP